MTLEELEKKFTSMEDEDIKTLCVDLFWALFSSIYQLKGGD